MVGINLGEGEDYSFGVRYTMAQMLKELAPQGVGSVRIYSKTMTTVLASVRHLSEMTEHIYVDSVGIQRMIREVLDVEVIVNRDYLCDAAWIPEMCICGEVPPERSVVAAVTNIFSYRLLKGETRGCLAWLLLLRMQRTHVVRSVMGLYPLDFALRMIGARLCKPISKELYYYLSDKALLCIHYYGRFWFSNSIVVMSLGMKAQNADC